jgi:diguanylate cyclase (GGDEF)-like protein
MELDVLLPIANRRAYEEQLSHYAAAATEINPLSLVLVDVDHFKSFNDNHGHKVGDSVLIEIAKVLQAVTNGQGDAFRYGGEELVMLLPNHTLREAESIAERARRSIELIQLPGLDETITASFGVATMPQTTTDVSQLFEQADKALYTSKNDGRNRVICAELSGELKSVPKKQRYSVELSLEPLGIEPGRYEPRTPARWFMLGIKNSGTALAKYPMIQFDSPSGLEIDPYGVDGNRNFGLDQRPTDSSSVIFQGGADDVIFPDKVRQITKVMQRGVRIAQRGTSVIDPLSNLWRTLDRDTWVFKALTFSCEVSCEGATAAKNKKSIPEEQVDF